MSTTAERAQPVSFVESVLLRPAMYTLTGSFEEAVCFIDGYLGGVIHGNLTAPAAVEWEAFKDWLAETSGTEDAQIFLQFRDKSRGNGQAFAELLERLAEFRRENGRTTD